MVKPERSCKKAVSRPPKKTIPTSPPAQPLTPPPIEVPVETPVELQSFPPVDQIQRTPPEVFIVPFELPSVEKSLGERVEELEKLLKSYIQKVDERFDKLAIMLRPSV
jgi:hypothetical protein